jgi:FKBP-type peptidyl-prolyl cis-trans isomerase 2
MSTIKEGDTIRVHYVGKLADGSVFDTSEGGASLEIKIGKGEFLPGIEKGVLGMSVGEKKTIRIPAGEGYPHHKERVFEYDRSKLPEDLDLAEGRQMQMFRADGQPVTVTVVRIGDKTVTLDCNHPLAGKELIFDIAVEEIL